MWQEESGLSPGDTEQCACGLCRLWSYTLEGPTSLSAHDRKAHCFPQMSSSFGRVVTGNRLCEDLGTLRSWLQQAFDSLSQIKRRCCKATWFSLPRSRCQQSAWSIRACGARLPSKTGECSTAIPQAKKVKRGSSRLHDWLSEFYSHPFRLCPCDCLLICCPFAFWPLVFLSRPLIQLICICSRLCHLSRT